jgi:DNA-binding NarL/FixJ family response regulator
MDEARRQQILAAFAARSAEFDRVAARRPPSSFEAGPLPLKGDGELSRRELDVLELVAAGFANHEIAKRLFLSRETVKTHVCRILVKLPARNRAHAVTLGFTTGLLQASALAERAEPDSPALVRLAA